jgi:hypothetical protein
VTTASQANAVAAHEQGSPHCGGEIDLIADFKTTPAVVLPAGRRRRRPAASRPGQGAIQRPQ